MNYGFIGAGNMGSAIFKGMIKSGFAEGKNIYIYDNNKEMTLKYKNELNINICDSYEDLIYSVDTVILAVKPNIFKTLLPEISKYIERYSPLIVSIAAGISLDKISELIGFETPIVRVMPNINAEISMSTTAYCGNSKATKENIETVKNCFNSVGYTVQLEEEKFPIFSAIAGCSPAYVYLFIDSLAKGAQKAGLNKKAALEIAANAVLGSTQMLINSKEHPWELIDKVCSPGGTTIEGICTLEEYKFESAVVKAVENSINKDKSLH